MIPINSPPAQPQQSQGPATGPTKWANDGFLKMQSHAKDADKQWLEDNKGVLLTDSKAQNLLISASSFQPGSKPLDDILKHLKGRIK